jgi:thymidylate synthase
MQYFFNSNDHDICTYILAEHRDRIGMKAVNPGSSYQYREKIWNEFLHDGKFSYTYSERMTYQLRKILSELRQRPETRQAIIEIHNNLNDLDNMGGIARIPCSLSYQVMIRENKVDLIYTMRSCDLLTHFPIDVCLALLLQDWFVNELSQYTTGTFTIFMGSLHAYKKDLDIRGIF